MNEFTTHWEWITDCIDLFGKDIQETAKELEISFTDAIALYSFVLSLSSADCEEYHRTVKYDGM